MKRLLPALVIVFCICPSVLASVGSITVTGGSFATDTSLSDGFGNIGLLTSSLSPTTFTLTPTAPAGIYDLAITTFNTTGEEWVGVGFTLTNSGFTSEPSLSFGLADAASIGGASNESATLTTSVPANSLLAFDLQFSLGASPITLIMTPLVPEPATAAMLACASLWVLGRRR